MKKFLLLILIFSQSNFCDAQTAFNNFTSFSRHSFLKTEMKNDDLFKKTSLNSNAKKKKLFQVCELNLKIGSHISEIKSNHFTWDDFSCKSITVGIPSPFMHYLIVPQTQVNIYLTNKFFLFNKFFFIETGIQKTSTSYEIKKVDGSHIYNDTLFDCYWYQYDSTLENITQLKNAYYYFEIPLQIGIEWKRISFSIGISRVIDKLFVVKKTTSINKTISSSNYFLDKPYSDNLHSQINFSVALIDKKIKLRPFVSEKFDGFFHWKPYTTVGLELGYNFKEKK